MRGSNTAPRRRRAAALALAAVLALTLVSCAQPATTPTDTTAATPTEFVLASTTSTQDSGLFDVLIPAFEKANPGYKVKVIAVGTGEALKLGETKDADVLLVHAKADEEKFVAAGFGKQRNDVMYNDFVLVGSEADPAGVKAAADITATMNGIRDAGVSGNTVFVSRGDDSGTHKKELKLWVAAGVEPTPTPEADKWYLSTGQGMGETLKITSEKQGYTLVDRATFLSMKDAVDLVILREGDKDLLNQYGVIVVTGAKNEAAGQTFADWVLSAEGQKAIGDFGVEQYGQQLFVPNAQ
jgi:tungstate transport system substrate-binding protein